MTRSPTQLGRGLEIEDLPRPDPADDERVGGWMLMYELLARTAGSSPQNCARLIESLPMLTRDEANIEDVLKCEGDDVADAARYGFKSRMAPRLSNHTGRDAELAYQSERLAAANPTSRAIWMRKLESDSRRRMRPAAAPRRWHV